MIRCTDFHQWQANLRILDVAAIKTVPYVPLSHPFVERLIGTIRRECLDQTLFWTTAQIGPGGIAQSRVRSGAFAARVAIRHRRALQALRPSHGRPALD